MKLLAVDGNSVLNRAFFAIKPLTTSDGIYTNAILGFLNIFMKLLKEYSPDAVAIAFDVSRHTFRNDMYDEYKANRKGMPEELRMQLPIIKEILTYMGYNLATAEGYEGDDVLGTLSAAVSGSEHECVVATGDKDCLQLLENDETKVCLLKTKENILYDKELFKAEYGFSPVNIIDLKSLMGDSSDNIPGVKGVGEKTAMELLKEYNSILNVYDNLDSLNAKPRVIELLRVGKEQAELSYKLATICTSAPIDTDISHYIKGEGDKEQLSAVLKKLEMFSYFEKLSIPLEVKSKKDNQKEKKTEKVMSFSVVAPSELLINNNDDVSLLLLNDEVYIAANEKAVKGSFEECKPLLETIFKQKNPVYTFMAKPIYKLAKSFYYDDILVSFDSEIAAYLLNPSSKSYDLKTLVIKYLPNVSFDVEEEFRPVCALKELCDEFRQQLAKTDSDKLYNDIELPLCEVLADMELEGFKVDTKGLSEFGEMLIHDINLTKEQIFRLAGEEFNINSTKELGNILFEKLSLPAAKKTKTGYSTNIDVLEELADKHEIVPQIMEYRKLTKLHSTYVVGLLKEIGEDNRVHSTFNQTETRTGRISSTEPNVQNIPVRTKLGSEMRRFFVAREGYTLIDADYSQIELRILAHIANDTNMKKAFLNNTDIHAVTASQVFHHPLETLPSELRSRAKAINFGIVYGISAFSLSKDINVTVSEAKKYMEEYLATYSGVADYMQQVVKDAQENNFVKTIYGRRRDLHEINSSNGLLRAFAKRVAFNTPVQGTAADIIKLAMIKVYRRLKKEGQDAKLILQVHDELIVEAPVLQAEYIKGLLKEEMENAADLSVPLVTDVNVGNNWYIAKG